MSCVPGCKFLIVFAWEIATLATMVYLLFYTTSKHVATTLKKAIIRTIPTTFAQWAFFHHRFSAFILSNPTLTSIPFNDEFCRVNILIHRDFVGSTLAAINTTSRHFQYTHIISLPDIVKIFLKKYNESKLVAMVEPTYLLRQTIQIPYCDQFRLFVRQ